MGVLAGRRAVTVGAAAGRAHYSLLRHAAAGAFTRRIHAEPCFVGRGIYRVAVEGSRTTHALRANGGTTMPG